MANEYFTNIIINPQFKTSHKTIGERFTLQKGNKYAVNRTYTITILDEPYLL